MKIKRGAPNLSTRDLQKSSPYHLHLYQHGIFRYLLPYCESSRQFQVQSFRMSASHDEASMSKIPTWNFLSSAINSTPPKIKTNHNSVKKWLRTPCYPGRRKKPSTSQPDFSGFFSCPTGRPSEGLDHQQSLPRLHHPDNQYLQGGFPTSKLAHLTMRWQTVSPTKTASRLDLLRQLQCYKTHFIRGFARGFHEDPNMTLWQLLRQSHMDAFPQYGCSSLQGQSLDFLRQWKVEV